MRLLNVNGWELFCEKDQHIFRYKNALETYFAIQVINYREALTLSKCQKKGKTKNSLECCSLGITFVLPLFG